MQGMFYNPRAQAGGSVTVTLQREGDALQGTMNLTGFPDVKPRHCGAGSFTASRRLMPFSFSFVSQDADDGCGADWEALFDGTGTLDQNDTHLTGGLTITNAGRSAVAPMAEPALTAVLAAVGLPILHIPWQPQYDSVRLAEQIHQTLYGTSQPSLYRSVVPVHMPSPSRAHAPALSGAAHQQLSYACGQCHRPVGRNSKYCPHCSTVLTGDSRMTSGRRSAATRGACDERPV
jgi:hypothetical protein